MLTLLGFVLAMSITLVLVPQLMRWAPALGVVDQPESRKVHSEPVPRVGGIAMGIGVIAAMVLYRFPSSPMLSLDLGILVLLAFGVWDDRASLHAGPKFLGQAIAVLIVMVWGGVVITSMTGFERTEMPVWIAMPLTFFFLMGGTNAFNLADGLDGLAGGMSILCLCGTALLAFTVDMPEIGSVAVAMIGAVLGFLRYNTYPARVFMGDAGSQVLGFSASVLALLLTQNPDNPLSTALPLLLLGMPLIDTLMVMTLRLLAGQSPFRADRRHIHHRLLAIGFEHWQAVSVFYLMQAMLFVAAWFLRYASDVAVVSVFVVFSLVVLGTLYLAQRRGWHIGVRQTDAEPPLRALGPNLVLRRASSLVVGASLIVYGGWVWLYGSVPNAELRWAPVAMVAALLGGLLWRRGAQEASWVDKALLYASATLAVFLAHSAMVDANTPSIFEWILFPTMALAVLACINTVRDQPFRVTPLDVLVLLLVFIVPNLPGSAASGRSLGYSLGELVLLFYALEALSFAASRQWRWINGATAVFLCGLIVRGFA